MPEKKFNRSLVRSNMAIEAIKDLLFPQDWACPEKPPQRRSKKRQELNSSASPLVSANKPTGALLGQVGGGGKQDSKEVGSEIVTRNCVMSWGH